MKRTIKLTESDLHRIIEQVINEMPSLDTLHAAKLASWNKTKKLGDKYGENDPRSRRAYDQYKNICNGYNDQHKKEVGDDDRRNLNRAARNKEIDNGDLKYVSGKGWRRNKNESLDRIVRESIKRALRESEDEFVPHGYFADSNFGGKEVQISDSGDSARFRRNYGEPEDPTDWLEIQYHPEREDFGGYCKTPWGDETLSNYMKY